MKYILFVLLLPYIAFSQVEVPDDAKMITKTVWLDTLTVDSALVCELPPFVAIERIYITVDTALVSSGGTDSIKVGIQGEKTITPHRFADLKIDSLSVGQILALSHYATRQNVVGEVTTENGTVSIVAETAEQFYPAEGFDKKPDSDLPITTSGALLVSAYREGKYAVMIGVSYESDKVGYMHGVIQRNASMYGFVEFKQSVSNLSVFADGSRGGTITLAEGDSVKFAASSSANNTVFTIEHGDLSLVKIPDGQPYVTDKIRKIYLYCDAATGQIRVIVKYRSIL